ncbi:MAG: hypothetical protein WD894_15185 [Pirellulales bacterium]
MSTDNPQSEVPKLDEDLVAYLDGELDDPASRRLEERLANDDSARERLRALATSWNLLDHLPRAALDEAFTRTTVGLVVEEARKEIAAEQAALPIRKRRRWIAAAVAGLAAAMIGFTAIVVAWPDENERLLRDLPVVQNYELYDVTPPAGAIDFLRRLEAKELFVDEARTDNEHPEWGTSTDAIADEELNARRAFVEALPTAEKNKLRKLYERFRAKPEEAKHRLRALDAELRSDPEGARLRTVLESYHNWLPTLSPLERADLLKMAPKNAIAKIEELRQQQLHTYHRTGRSRQGPLTSSDVDVIDRWLQERISKKKDEILANAKDEDRQWFAGLAENRKTRSLMILSGEPWPPRPKLDDKEWEELLNRLPTVKALFAASGKATEMDKLVKQFPLPSAVQANVKEDINKAATPQEQQSLLFRWNGDAQRARMAVGGGVPPEELNRFLKEELSEKERNDLMELPPEQFHFRLRMAYFKRDFPPGWQPPFRRGGWGRGKGDGRGPGDGDHRRFEGDRRDDRGRERNRRDDRGGE